MNSPRLDRLPVNLPPEAMFAGYAKRGTGTYRAACPRCDKGPRDTALAVTVHPDGAVLWMCHRCEWAGVDSTSARRETHKPSLSLVSSKADDRIARARAICNESMAIDPGTPGHEYLTGRNCCVPPSDGDLRQHGDLKLFGFAGPAVVGRITAADDRHKMLGLHLSWLKRDGKSWRRTERRYLGGKKGGVVRLWPEEVVSGGIGICEGLETALSLAHAYRPVWAALDAANLATFPPLPGFGCLVIGVDNDRAGRSAASDCARRWAAAGSEVTLAMSPAAGNDLNDEVRG